MSLQVCIRCRKRRIKCGLQLPACKNCRAADVECLFWDDSLEQEIPCSYLHSLNQKVQSLQLEIQYATDDSCEKLPESGNGDESAHILEDYHLSIFDSDALPSPSRTAYLGPGSSARLLECLLKETIRWHLLNNVQIPKRLLPDEPSSFMAVRDSKSTPSFPLNLNLREPILHTLVPPSTQRAIIEHYLITVSPEYTLLSAEQESAMLAYENPLRWSSTNKDMSGAFAINIVFAISASLVTRDLDPKLSSISVRCVEEVHKLSERAVRSEDPIEVTTWTCTAICALAVCEMVNTVSGQLWDVLGRAVVAMEHLRDAYQLRSLDLDEPFRRLERSLLKLEISAALHLRRPSQLCERRLKSTCKDDPVSDELKMFSHLHQISHEFAKSRRAPETFFESLIPPTMQRDSVAAKINMNSAILYTALHPLFTTTDANSGRMLINPSSRLFNVIGSSACMVIYHYSQLNESSKILSLWMAAERVLEAGVVWAAYLISQRQPKAPAGQHFKDMGIQISMGPIYKVSALLASFTGRWKSGSAYVEAWDTLVELLMSML